MEKLNEEYERLISEENAAPSNELKKYFIIERKKWASVSFRLSNPHVPGS